MCPPAKLSGLRFESDKCLIACNKMRGLFHSSALNLLKTHIHTQTGRHLHTHTHTHTHTTIALSHRLMILSSKADTHTHTHTHFLEGALLWALLCLNPFNWFSCGVCANTSLQTCALTFHSQDKQTHKPLTIHFRSICWEQSEANCQIDQFQEIIRDINDQLNALTHCSDTLKSSHRHL